MADADFLPVVQRELREGARRPFNYWLRVAGALAGVLLLCVISHNADADDNQAATGLRLFIGLHEMLLVLICVMVPAMSADCIAREKREGTLGLLFLTPLTAMGIVLGKGLVQAFRAFTLWIAVLPVLIIPFLSGGVTGGDVAGAITIEFCVTLLCLAAGLLASTLAKARSTAFFLAVSLGVEFVCLFGGLLGLGYILQSRGAGQSVGLIQFVNTGQSLITGQSDGGLVIGRPGGAMIPPSSPVSAPSTVMMLVNGRATRVVMPASTWMSGMRVPWIPPPAGPPPVVQSPFGWSAYFSAPATSDVWWSLLLQSWLAVPLLFLLVLHFAARHMARSWQDQPPSLRRESWIKTYCLPQAKDRFAHQMRETLEWNPIAWLQQYSWKARLSKWGLCLGLVLIECVTTMGGPSQMQDVQSVMVMVLAGAFTFASVGRFLTEKKSGALELLLVTPVPPDQIIFGRVWGLWKQFLPAGVTLLLLWQFAQSLASFGTGVYFWPQRYHANSGIMWSLLTAPVRWSTRPHSPYGGSYFYDSSDFIDNPSFKVFVTVVGFLTLPVLATYFALRVKNLVAAAALTWLALILCPLFAFSGLAFLSDGFSEPFPPVMAFVGVLTSSVTFALLACFLLRHSLSRRIYSF